MSNFKFLKNIHRQKRLFFDEDFSIRIHRSLSWLERSEKENNDSDAQFIFLWISFNAAYNIPFDEKEVFSERGVFTKFFDIVLKLNNQKIYDFIWSRFSEEIRNILQNEYIMQAYWVSNDGEYINNWQEIKSKAIHKVNQALVSKDTKVILDILFQRLYVLRNQIIHGGATWKGKLNRQQVNDGTKLLNGLVPVFIELMLEHPTENWGRIPFPITN